jgi:Flp pilus assembly pilin Flp
MTNMLSRLWNDDQGAVVSVELLLIIGILIFGLIPGLVALRNSIDAAMTTTGNILLALVPSFTFSGFLVGPQAPVGAGQTNIASVNGFQRDFTTQSYLTADQTAPVLLPAPLSVPPAP